MAASGIAEHNEARRKEMSMQKQAFKKRELLNNLRDQFGDNPDLVGSYESEIAQMRRNGSPPGNADGAARHDAAYVDQMRRNQLRQQQLFEYSAKIPNRFSSTDYSAQW